MLPANSLYLARSIHSRSVTYSIRLSYWDEEQESYLFRELIDCRTDPARYIIYPNDSSFYLDGDFVDEISRACGWDAEEKLEKMLWPFVAPDIQIKMDHFFHRTQAGSKNSINKQRQIAQQNIHLFDQRRLHFLRFCRTDQGPRFQLPPRLMAKLTGKSRDELEQYFLRHESILTKHELKSYLYAALNLQQHFSQSFSRSMPQALPQEEIDHFFIQEICKLEEDEMFWRGITRGHCLHPYLSRYLIDFFDNSFPRANPGADYARDFMNGHRQFRWPETKNTMGKDEVNELFGESAETLANLDKKELTRLYRQKAKELHPDTGGEHDDFLRLTQAYEELLRRKPI